MNFNSSWPQSAASHYSFGPSDTEASQKLDLAICCDTSSVLNLDDNTAVF